MIAQLFQFILSTLGLDVVQLLLRLFKIVFQKLEELHANAFRSAADSLFRRHDSELLSVSHFLSDEESVHFWCLHTHLICDVGILLGDFGRSLPSIWWHFTLSILTVQLSAISIDVDRLLIMVLLRVLQLRDSSSHWLTYHEMLASIVLFLKMP